VFRCEIHPVVTALLGVTRSEAVVAVDAAAGSDEKPGRKIIDQAEALAYRSNRSVMQCLRLMPVPSPRPPRGF